MIELTPNFQPASGMTAITEQVTQANIRVATKPVMMFCVPRKMTIKASASPMPKAEKLWVDRFCGKKGD